MFLEHVLLGQVFVYEARIPRSSGLIGKASVGLREFVDVGTNVQWVILKDANGVYAGEVCLVLRYTKMSQTGINKTPLLQHQKKTIHTVAEPAATLRNNRL